MDQVRAALLVEDAPVTGAGVTIAVLDTGVDTDHPDLQEAVDSGESRSFSLRGDLTDRHGHGTHVCGIIAGSGAASEGRLRGIAPGARLIVFKVMEGREGSDMDVPAGVAAALDAGAHIINYSAGQRGPHVGPWKWPFELGFRDETFRQAATEGVLCVAAAGNEGHWQGSSVPGTVIRPANLPSVLCAGSTTDRTAVAEVSGRGPVYIDNRLRPNEVGRFTLGEPGVIERPYRKPDVVVPGEHVGASRGSPLGTISTRSREALHVHPLTPDDPDDPYGRLGGTSQATAVVTGMAALAMEYARRVGLELGPTPGATVMAILSKSAVRLDVGDSTDFGHGFLLWPSIQALIEDCAEDPSKRDAVFMGPGLQLLL